MKEKLVVFDYDGVIVDSLDINLGIAEQACKEIEHSIFPTKADIEQLDNLSFEDLGRQIGLSKEKSISFANHVFKLLTNNDRPPKIFPGMNEIIQELGERNHIAIVTTNVKHAADQVLEEHRLHDKVDLIIGAEQPGSKAEKIMHVIVKFKGEHNKTYMIGDATSDIREARKARVKSIAVTWGYHSREKLEKADPDFIVNIPYEIVPILNAGNHL